MTNIAARTELPALPPWAMVGGSLFIVFHFLALGALVLAAPSGPWPMSFGTSPAPGPPFAVWLHQRLGPNYLRPLHLENDYHFVSNVPAMPAVFFEVHLKDEAGKVMTTLKFPEDKANPWVLHRERLLAQGLGNDLPVQVPPGEKVLPPGKTYPMVEIWKGGDGDPVQKLTKVSELEVPRNRQVLRPAEWSVLLAKSYARYLCRQNGAASAEVVRHSRNAILPDALFVGVPREAFSEQVCIFGEYRP